MPVARFPSAFPEIVTSGKREPKPELLGQEHSDERHPKGDHR
jgi:hypothetical protein